MRKKTPSPAPDRFLGLPGSWTFPGWEAVRHNLWNTDADAQLFPRKVYGFGWSFNFAYPRIRSKPPLLRLLAWMLGMFFVLLIVYALISLPLALYVVLAGI